MMKIATLMMVAGLGSANQMSDFANRHLAAADASRFLAVQAQLTRQLTNAGQKAAATSNAPTTQSAQGQSSSEDSDITSQCENVQPYCSNGIPAQASAEMSAEQQCILPAALSFFCGTICGSCKDFLKENADSANDMAASDSAMFTNEKLGSICGGGCLPKLMNGMVSIAKTASSCSGDDSSDSGNDGSSGGSSSSGNDSGNDNEMSKSLGLICQQNEQGDYCMSAFMGLAEKQSNTSSAAINTNTSYTCDTPAVKDLVGLGCCFGSVLAATSVTEGDKSFMEELAYFVSKCGGTVIPCAKGSLYASNVITSSVTIKADGLTEEFLEKPEVQAAIKKGIVKNLNKGGKTVVSEDGVVIVKISIVAARRGRSLTGTSAAVDYSVLSQDENFDASAASSAMKSMDSSALTSDLAADPALSSVASSLAATPSTADPTVQTVAAQPVGSGGSSGMSGGALAGIIIACLCVVVAAIGGVVYFKRQQSKQAGTINTGGVVAKANANSSNPGAEQL